MFWFAIHNGAGQTQMSTIALIDTRLKIPGESIGTVVSLHDTIRAAFKANEAFQKRMRDSGVKDHVPTKIVTLSKQQPRSASHNTSENPQRTSDPRVAKVPIQGHQRGNEALGKFR